MCQTGAAGRGKVGMKYDGILYHYYHGTLLHNLNPAFEKAPKEALNILDDGFYAPDFTGENK